MNDLTRTVLARRPFVQDGTLLDCLELAEHLGPRIRAGLTPQLTTAELEQRWNCDQDEAIRRIRALRDHGLINASNLDREGYWEVNRVGPVT